MTKRNSDTTELALVVFLEEKHRELVQSQFNDAIESSDVDALYRAFLEDTITACLDYHPAHVIVSSSGGKGEKIVNDAIDNLKKNLTGRPKTRLESDGVEVWKQNAGSLAANLEKTFKSCFEAGYQHVLLIDCVTPTINHQMFTHATRALKKKDIVLGPTLEGSYYLLGMRKEIPQIFTRIDWTQDEQIYSRIVEVACADGLDWEELELWYDLRQPGDLEFLVRDINAFRIVGDEISAKRTEVILESLIQKLQREES